MRGSGLLGTSAATSPVPGAGAGAAPGAVATGKALNDVVGIVRVPAGSEAQVAAALRTLPGVVAAEPDRLRSVALVPNDPAYPLQWAHALTGAEGAWDLTTGVPGVRVAVVDSGIDGTHPDLAANVAEQVRVAGGTLLRRSDHSDNDACGHGTAVAGVLAAAGGNASGVAGVAWNVSLIDIAIADVPADLPPGIPRAAGPARSLTAPWWPPWTTPPHPGGPVDVVNLSLGGLDDRCPAAMQAAIDRARRAEVVVVAAAGNFGAATTSVPASCNGVIAVGAVGRGGVPTAYTSANPYVDLSAPGGSYADGGDTGLVISTATDGTVQGAQGTSFAAPYVAGVAALVRSVRPELSADDVESVLESTAADLGAGGRDESTGWGLVRVDAAVRRALAAEPIPAPAPDPDFAVLVPALTRIASSDHTEPVTQAVAMSRAAFVDGGATHALLARPDDFADALSGSALGYGLGPLLFTSAGGSLDPRTDEELGRVLPAGATVYLLGGPRALPPTLEGELAARGYTPKRLAGAAREETAVRVGEEVRRLLPALSLRNPSAVLLATARSWPDAVSAGSLAAFTGIPVLLTGPDGLHPATAAALAGWAPGVVYVVGGEAAVSTPVEQAARAAAGGGRGGGRGGRRLAGPTRVDTALAVADEVERLAGHGGVWAGPAVAVNLRRADGFAHALSASSFAGAFAGTFVPVEEDAGRVLTPATCTRFFGRGADAFLAGGRDLISDATGERLQAILSGTAVC